MSSFEKIGVVDLLEHDPRPSFVVSIPGQGQSSQHEIIYKNPALASHFTLREAISAVPSETLHQPFWSWVTSSPERADLPNSHSLSYHGIFWTRYTLLGQWIVMSGNGGAAPSSEQPRKVRIGSARDGQVSRSITRERASSELDSLPDLNLPVSVRAERDRGLQLPDFTPDSEPFLDVIQSVHWEDHPLGPMEKWPARLQEIFNQILPESRAIALYWGPQHYAIYNESFSQYCGASHPGVLGSPALEFWPHMKDSLERATGSSTGKSTKIEDESRFFVEKPDGFLEETYVKWSMTPIMDRRKCVGIQHTLLETTSMRLWERRMKMLIDLGETLVTARDVKSYWSKTLEELESWSPSYDVPLAFIYSISEDDDNDSSRSRYDCPRICRREGALGVPPGHVIAPDILQLRDTDEGLAPMFREAMQTEYPLLLQIKDGTLPEPLLEGLEWRGFGDPCQAAIICPIRPTKEESVMGVLFLGLNPRRHYDNDYRQFISLLNQKLAASLASTVLLEEEERRGRNAAAQAAFDTDMLQKKLAYQTEQTNESVQNFQAVADFIPVGMSFHDNHGHVTYANDSWYRITGYPKGPITTRTLLECAVEEDRSNMALAYEQIEHSDVVTFEFRIRRASNLPTDWIPMPESLTALGEQSFRHVLASAKAERASDGSVVRILTCLTDVTVQKRAAEEAVRRAQVAENLKRLAEFATVGMYDMSVDGRLLSANNLFWELSGIPKVDLAKVIVEPWQTCVLDDDLPVLRESMEKLKLRGRPQTAEIRLKTPWSYEDADGNTVFSPKWVLASFIPVKTTDGNIRSFTGCMSDVSLQKLQLEQEKSRKEEAIESRRQQENFIDMTSHEMRNPLSAILHCTDAIIASLTRVQDIADGALPLTPQGTSMNPADECGLLERGRVDEEKKLLEDSIENAETIVTCAQHQKRIVDDILTMSKLDSKLLAVTPCTVNPVDIVHDAVKMFEVEARRVDIVLTSVVDRSYTMLGHEYLDMDPSRIQQVLINLLTNALKFTKTGKTRSVTVCVKGSRTPPGKELTGVDFIPRFCDLAEEYEQPGLKDRTDPVYLLFEVKDTGQGLTEKEMGSLFNKFVQASAKTHVKYGGSGLGLFISRRLTELQNGAIGVSSQTGVGSTFAFYIEAYQPSEDARKQAEATAAATRIVASTEGARGSGSGPGAQGSRRGVNGRLQRHHNPGGHERLDGILIVEDNLINQQITRRGLSERGYSVDVANHGIEALDKLRRSVGASRRPPMSDRRNSVGAGLRGSPNPQAIPLNLVLMDVEMPIQDGLTCTRQIRELEGEGHVYCASGGRIPIIAVTANARPEQITEAKDAGCDDVLVKPYRIPELIEKMQVVIRRMGGLSPNSPVP